MPAEASGPAEQLREQVDRFIADINYPMFIVTVGEASGDPAGCLVGFVTQSSIRPPRFLVGLSVKNYTYRVARGATHLGLHLLAADQRPLATQFGTLSRDQVDKFSGIAWRPGPHNVPLLTDCRRWVIAEVLDRHPLGDHVGFVVQPIEVFSAGPLRPLTFAEVRDLDAGHDA